LVIGVWPVAKSNQKNDAKNQVIEKMVRWSAVSKYFFMCNILQTASLIFFMKIILHFVI